MAKVLDFNSLQRPTFEVTMKDDARTKLRLVCPKESLVERLESGLKELREILEKKDGSSIRACFQLAADLFSENDNGVEITAEMLRDRYRIALEDLVVFFSAYTDFINEIKNAKN